MTIAEDFVYIQEVSPRDGLQIEPRWLETTQKIALIDSLSEAGFTRIEAGSFVSPAAVPMLKDGAEVFARICRAPGCVYVALVPNAKGAARALDAGAGEINFVLSASETHNRANMRMSCEASFSAFEEAAKVCGNNLLLNGTIATAFGCPFEGRVPAGRVLAFAKRYLHLGAQSLTLADTTGMANPRQVKDMVREALKLIEPSQLTLHFHNTRGMGLANMLAAYSAGARRFDASVGGLGGCPFAPGATGNICTEDLAHMCEEMGIKTGLDLGRLIALSRKLPDLLGHGTPGQVAKAGRSSDLHPVPSTLAR